MKKTSVTILPGIPHKRSPENFKKISIEIRGRNSVINLAVNTVIAQSLDRVDQLLKSPSDEDKLGIVQVEFAPLTIRVKQSTSMSIYRN